MNIQKFTQKSIETIQNCEKLAYEYGNQELDLEHLAYAFIRIDDSLIAGLLEKMGINLKDYSRYCEKLLAKRVKVSGNVELKLSQSLNKVLVCAEDEAKKMADSYVSVEHIFLSMIQFANEGVSKLLAEFNITRDGFLQALQSVRGNKNVTSDNPEATYDTLAKYGVDLVKRAREQKLDPVIGRDSEIRNIIRILSRKTKNNPVLALIRRLYHYLS